MNKRSLSAVNDPKVHIACYKCKAGCIHLEFGNAMLTFNDKEFADLADVVRRLDEAIKLNSQIEENEEILLQGEFFN